MVVAAQVCGYNIHSIGSSNRAKPRANGLLPGNDIDRVDFARKAALR